MAHNLIREIPPDSFKSFPNLTYLNLQGNQVASVEELGLPLTLLELNLGNLNLLHSKNIGIIDKIMTIYFRIQPTSDNSSIPTAKPRDSKP